MKLQELLKKSRSYRKFKGNEAIDDKILEYAVENVRYTPSPANKQPLKFMIINDKNQNEKIFPHLSWAAYLKEWNGPKTDERPAAYIIILGDTSLSKYISWDYGIALMIIILSLREKGLGACAIVACDKQKIRKEMKIEKKYEIAVVIAIGKSKENVVIKDVIGGDIKYYRDSKGNHYVPKRILDDLLYKKIKRVTEK